MPIYEYQCRKCRHRFEAILQGSARAACPECGAASLEKQLSVFAVGGGGTEHDLPAKSPCGSCGDPRGPGSCALD